MNKQLAIPWQPPPAAQMFMTQLMFDSQIKGMQSESDKWHQEHRSWKRDITAWQKRQRRIEAILYQLERELPDYRDVAAHLSDVIEEHERRLSEHDRLLKEYLGNDETDPAKWTELDLEHENQARMHAAVQEEHEAFRTAYLAAMKKVERLVKRLQSLCATTC